jgi:hypothetical protein
MNASVKRPGLLWPSLIVLGAIGVASVASNSALAGSPLCNERTVVLKTLEKDYGEKPIAFGITENGALVQLIAAKDGKTWTLVIHNPKGISCLMAAGETWKTRREPQHAVLHAGGPR